MIFLYQTLLKKDATCSFPNSDMVGINNGEVNIVNLYSGDSSIGKFDTILTVTPPKANDRLYRELFRNNMKCHVMGDAAAPRDA